MRPALFLHGKPRPPVPYIQFVLVEDEREEYYAHSFGCPKCGERNVFDKHITMALIVGSVFRCNECSCTLRCTKNRIVTERVDLDFLDW